MPNASTILKLHFRLIGLLVLFFVSLTELYAQADSVMAAGSVMRPDTLYLPVDTAFLGEAVILPYKTYAEFKQAFLNHDSQSAGALQAQRNGEIVRNQIRMGVTPEMNAYENFRNQVTYNLLRSQGFVIISTNPNQGVVPLIRKVMGK